MSGRPALPARALLCDDPSQEVRLHQPLNGRSERYACEGIDISLSMLADEVGGVAAAALVDRYTICSPHEEFMACDREGDGEDGAILPRSFEAHAE
jgi:hypothetical protein